MCIYTNRPCICTTPLTVAQTYDKMYFKHHCGEIYILYFLVTPWWRCPTKFPPLKNGFDRGGREIERMSAITIISQ